MIVLKRARFISGGRILRAGSVLPDNEITHSLAEKGYAEIVNDPPKQPARKVKPEITTAQQNDKGDS
ncbi:MAG: hypothetical protein IJL18_00250 [Synergistaceae bacterium]|nr:hypothetical protein [Synergistaceae bacterium]MBR0278796.1 hypothetical protein [Synergistaceae bacterium]